jgi:hypothetical protein
MTVYQFCENTTLNRTLVSRIIKRIGEDVFLEKYLEVIENGVNVEGLKGFETLEECVSFYEYSRKLIFTELSNHKFILSIMDVVSMRTCDIFKALSGDKDCIIKLISVVLILVCETYEDSL